jgi:hypothetical protein
VWVRHKRAGRPDIFIRADEYSGENTTKLPEGAKEAYTVDPRGADRLRVSFANFARRYSGSEFGRADPDLARSFAHAVDACEPTFHERVTHEIADDLSNAGAFVRDAEGKLTAVDGRVVASVVNMHLDLLKDRYAKYGADSWLVGCLQTARDASMGVAAVSGDQNDWPRSVAEFFSTAWSDPGDLAVKVIRKSIGGGALHPIISLAEGRRDQLDEMIEQARNAPDVDAMLERIYLACPVADECWLLYWTLKDAPDPIAPEDKRRVSRQVFKLVRERRGRLKGGLARSVLDLDGYDWNVCRGAVAWAQGQGGSVAAKAREAVDKNMWYPRALLPALLAGITERSA